MTLQQLVFYVFAGLVLFAAGMVVTSRNPVRGVLFLVLAFFASAVLWMLLQAEFLSLVLIFVYIGAVMTLFLFVVMMLNLDVTPKQEGFVRYLPFGLLVMAVLAGIILMAVGPQHFGLAMVSAPAEVAADFSNTKALGAVLYTDYVLAFQLAAVLLLVAIISAIALAFRGQQKRRSQVESEQIGVEKQDRVRLVNMESKGV